jgi:hypothetical protein
LGEYTKDGVLDTMSLEDDWALLIPERDPQVGPWGPVRPTEEGMKTFFKMVLEEGPRLARREALPLKVEVVGQYKGQDYSVARADATLLPEGDQHLSFKVTPGVLVMATDIPEGPFSVDSISILTEDWRYLVKIPLNMPIHLYTSDSLTLEAISISSGF